MEIDEATAGALARIHAGAFAASGRAWSAEEIVRLAAGPGVTALVAVDGGPVGFALLRVAADEAELLTIAVVPRLHGGGVGSALMREVLEAARDARAGAIHLEVGEDNARARALYAREGFAEVGRRPAYYRRPDGSAEDALALRLAL